MLVAGIGNLFCRDDGFGPEVVRRLLATGSLPEQVRAVDYGIRGMHLAYDLLEGYDALVLVDAVPGNGEPGEVTVLEVGEEHLGAGGFDPHGMAPCRDARQPEGPRWPAAHDVRRRLPTGRRR